MVQIETRPVEQVVKDQVIEISESTKDSGNGEGQTIPEAESDDMVGATRWQKAARRKKLEEARQAISAQKPIVDKQREGSQNDMSKSKLKAEEKPMSRAERRKKIKEQIMAEGQGETFKGYRRRMW